MSAFPLDIPNWLAVTLLIVWAFFFGRWTARRRKPDGPRAESRSASRVSHVPRMASDASTLAAALRNDAEVRRLVAAGQHIEAIKLVRSETGLGLKEAKDLCDAMRDGRA